ncbi:hypothetical protein O3M35_000884 [Rhynocoris fuscipes]|uniref:Uncharacterized protein n=1 Tax=Rhynocoris fuscipes TaxID=488301 RepID=A0AAW1DQF3_9HEMI
MKTTLIVLALSAAVCLARPQTRQNQKLKYNPPIEQSLDTQTVKPIAILSQSSQFNFDGNFNYDFQAENGIQSQAVGTIKSLGPEEVAQVMQGSYSYTAPDGTPITATWWADETGFHIEGAHLPTPPPIPIEIERSLEFLRTIPVGGKENQYDNGQYDEYRYNKYPNNQYPNNQYQNNQYQNNQYPNNQFSNNQYPNN